MKTYVVEDKVTDLETGKVNYYYTGKDGYVHDLASYADGYTKKRFALDSIRREMTSPLLKSIDERTAIESNRYIHRYNIAIIER